MRLIVQIDLSNTFGSANYMKQAFSCIVARENNAATFSILSTSSTIQTHILITDNAEMAKAFVLIHERSVAVLTGKRQPKEIPGFYEEIVYCSLNELDKGINSAIDKIP